MTVGAAARELGLGWRRARKVLRRLEHVFPADEAGTYDARILDLLRALRGQPHRALEPVETDWLARYLKESTHAATRPQGPQPDRPDG